MSEQFPDTSRYETAPEVTEPTTIRRQRFGAAVRELLIDASRTTTYPEAVIATGEGGVADCGVTRAAVAKLFAGDEMARARDSTVRAQVAEGDSFQTFLQKARAAYIDEQ